MGSFETLPRFEESRCSIFTVLVPSLIESSSNTRFRNKLRFGYVSVAYMALHLQVKL